LAGTTDDDHERGGGTERHGRISTFTASGAVKVELADKVAQTILASQPWRRS
jgi:hypothetical protein